MRSKDAPSFPVASWKCCSSGSILPNASGGESSPTTLYYGTRNALVVAERHAPLGPFGTWRRRALILAAHAAQALGTHRRREALVAVRDGWRDFRQGRLGPKLGP